MLDSLENAGSAPSGHLDRRPGALPCHFIDQPLVKAGSLHLGSGIRVSDFATQAACHSRGAAANASRAEAVPFENGPDHRLAVLSLCDAAPARSMVSARPQSRAFLDTGYAASILMDGVSIRQISRVRFFAAPGSCELAGGGTE
jgi:hypothetical protein